MAARGVSIAATRNIIDSLKVSEYQEYIPLTRLLQNIWESVNKDLDEAKRTVEVNHDDLNVSLFCQ